MNPKSTFSDNEWDNLIDFIREGSVVPILGPELSLVADPDTGAQILYDHWLARQLASKFPEVPWEKGWSLNKVVCTALRLGTKAASLHTTVKRLAANRSFDVPIPLRQIASIHSLPLYVTTAIDPLLTDAVSLSRGVVLLRFE